MHYKYIVTAIFKKVAYKFNGVIMYKTQYKKNSPYGSWMTVGSYGNESTAISMALSKKTAGAVLVRVVNKQGMIMFSS
jgi:hypothetical protein